MKVASKNDILGVNFARIEEIWVPEWKLMVRLRGLSAADRDAWSQEVFALSEKGVGVPNFRARLLSLMLVGEDGKVLFKGEAAQLGEQDSEVISRLYDAAMRLSKLGDHNTDAPIPAVVEEAKTTE